MLSFPTFFANGAVAQRSHPAIRALATKSLRFARPMNTAREKDTVVAQWALPAFLATVARTNVLQIQSVAAQYRVMKAQQS